ncbi:MAG TPA: LysM peptidoglycan-binding domain-containing protein, partial [Anaerolineales bacterium]|nr:LysM peptidoglycan-binding domain-containing protein [Anaerolineales bacterium]
SGTLRRDGDQIILTASGDGTDWQAPLVGPGKQYSLIDPPADLPLDNKSDSQLSVQGVLVNGSIDWYYIQYFENTSQMGGGGGGGGLGFYQLNLSGTPIPFPTPTAEAVSNQGSIEYVVKEGDTIIAIAESYGVTPDEIFQANDWLQTGEHALTPGKILIIPEARSSSGPGEYIVQEGDTLIMIAQSFGISVDELIQANEITDSMIFVGQTLIIPGAQTTTEQQVENLRGFLSIAIHKFADGSQKTAYNFIVNDADTQIFYELEESNLSELDPYNGLPIIISGTIRRGDAFIPTLSLDSYEIPFPDLQFQILKGRQQVQEIDGQIATLFTTENGQTYIEFLTNTGQLNFSIIGNEGDLIQEEVLIVPDETFASYSVIRVYSAGLVISPKDGQPMELPLTANEIPVFDAVEGPEILNATQPSLTIDSIELKYFVNNPYYQVNDPNYERRSTYIQPVWHFRGHYENGAKFDMLVQALKRDFLSPQLSPGITPG